MMVTLLANSINAISKSINDERYLGQPNAGGAAQGAQAQNEELVPRAEPDGIWSGRQALIRATGTLAQNGSGMPSELKQYFDQPVLSMESNPLEYWLGCKIFTPILANIALKSLLPQGSSVSSERVASTVNLAVPNNRSRLTGEHVDM
uniref:HAT C-terminal dimerisation domain-containing protein n=1 Tax=Cacopsylla melanoneura TaxID=428564 RepID=A0A8D9FFV4_9HEMI